MDVQVSPAVPNRRVEAATLSAGRSADALHQAVLAQLENARAGGVVLDFGAGEGRLAESLSESGRFTRVVAADLVQFPGRTEAADVEWIECDLNEPLPIADQQFDAITAVEVIEHLENSRFVAREWFRLIRPGGIVVATTPNNESWRSLVALLVRGHFVAFGDDCYPAHISALTRVDLIRVLEEAGFTRPVFFFSEHGALPRVTAVTWRAVSGGRLRGVRYSDNFGLVAVRPEAVAARA